MDFWLLEYSQLCIDDMKMYGLSIDIICLNIIKHNVFIL
jgi:hypothetical protein